MTSPCLSQYTRIYCYEDAAILYNTINSVCVCVPNDVVIEGRHVVSSDEELIRFLSRNIFFLEQVRLDKEVEKYWAQNILHVSLEISLSCNFSCPYCYQKNNGYAKTFIESGHLDSLYSYIVKVKGKANIDILNLKVLGGEPSITWEKIVPFLKKVYVFCHKSNIKLNLKVDTNGYYIEPFLSYDYYDSILFTVPLCYKDVHNQYRQAVGNGNTYDIIVKNLNELSTLRQSSIVLRHNTDAQNLPCYKAYLSELKESLNFRPHINLQYTTNPLFGDYTNKLTRSDFIQWLSTDCIDSMLDNGFDIYISPTKIGACSFNSMYSMKLFSSGKVGACARFFYNSSNPLITEILAKESLMEESDWWGNAKRFSPFANNECKYCTNLFSCGGHYFLPCIQDYQMPKCEPEKSLYLDYEEYFKRLYKAIKQGKSELFKNIVLYDMRQ